MRNLQTNSMRLRTPEVAPANLAVGEAELGRNAVVWQPILAAGGLSSPPGGLKGRLQARLSATRSTHIAAAGLTSISTTSGVEVSATGVPMLGFSSTIRVLSRVGGSDCSVPANAPLQSRLCYGAAACRAVTVREQLTPRPRGKYQSIAGSKG